MPKILIYNNDTNKIETYNRALTEPMPYIEGRTLTVREFRGSSNSDLLWTTKYFMRDFNKFRKLWGSPIYIGYAFKRIWQGGHTGMSQHYAGVAMDIGQNLTTAVRDNMRIVAINSNIFAYVEPRVLTPTWVHIDSRLGTPACSTGGYPLVKSGSKGIYVMVLQDALIYKGYLTGSLDGMFGPITKAAVLKFQRDKRLSADGIVGCNTWRAIINMF